MHGERSPPPLHHDTPLKCRSAAGLETVCRVTGDMYCGLERPCTRMAHDAFNNTFECFQTLSDPFGNAVCTSC